jgi:hypothetical protein
MTNQAVISIEDLYAWAKTQGNLGIAVLFIRAYDARKLTPQLVNQAIKVRDRQIADGRLVVEPAPYVPVTERITRRPPANFVETTQASLLSVEDESISPKRSVTRENPWPGIYTVETDEGHTTFRIELQPSDAKFAPGSTVISLLVGPDNTSDYTSFGFVKSGRLRPFKAFRSHEGLIEKANQFLRDPEAALVAKHCARCNRVLTTPESIAAGLGPECRRLGLR